MDERRFQSRHFSCDLHRWVWTPKRLLIIFSRTSSDWRCGSDVDSFNLAWSNGVWLLLLAEFHPLNRPLPLEFLLFWDLTGSFILSKTKPALFTKSIRRAFLGGHRRSDFKAISGFSNIQNEGYTWRHPNPFDLGLDHCHFSLGLYFHLEKRRNSPNLWKIQKRVIFLCYHLHRSFGEYSPWAKGLLLKKYTPGLTGYFGIGNTNGCPILIGKKVLGGSTFLRLEHPTRSSITTASSCHNPRKPERGIRLEYNQRNWCREEAKMVEV